MAVSVGLGDGFIPKETGLCHIDFGRIFSFAL